MGMDNYISHPGFVMYVLFVLIFSVQVDDVNKPKTINHSCMGVLKKVFFELLYYFEMISTYYI